MKRHSYTRIGNQILQIRGASYGDRGMPCLLSDGTVRTVNRDFESVTQLKDWLKRAVEEKAATLSVSTNYVDTEQADFTFTNDFHLSDWYWVLSLAFAANPLLFDSEPPIKIALEFAGNIEGKVIRQTQNIIHNSFGTELAAEANDDIYLVAEFKKDLGKHNPQIMAVPLLFELKKCNPPYLDSKLDKSVLVDARPDLSVFVSGYPLPESTASILRAVLSNVEHLDIHEVDMALKQIYVEAVLCGRLGKAIRNEKLATAEDVLEDFVRNYEKSSLNLPTLREILSHKTPTISFE